jgi:hypothetical protein
MILDTFDGVIFALEKTSFDELTMNALFAIGTIPAKRCDESPFFEEEFIHGNDPSFLGGLRSFCGTQLTAIG